MDTPSWLVEKLRLYNLKQADVARAVGVTGKSVSNWVHGVYEPSEENLDKMRFFFSQQTSRGVGIIYPPLNFTSCNCCDYLERCKRRVNLGLGIMCEGLVIKELGWAEEMGLLNELVWWKDCDSVSDLDLS